MLNPGIQNIILFIRNFNNTKKQNPSQFLQNKNKEISSKDQISPSDQSNSGPTTSEPSNKHTSISIKDSDSIRKAQEPQKLNIVISFIKDDEGIGQMVGRNKLYYKIYWFMEYKLV